MLQDASGTAASETLFVPHFVMLKTLPACFSWKRQWMRHPYLVLVKEGNGELWVDGTPFVLSPGNLYVLLPHSIVEARFTGRTRPKLYIVRFSYGRVSEAARAANSQKRQERRGDEAPLLSADVHIRISTTPHVMALMDQMIDCRSKRGPLARWKVTILFQQLVYTIVTGQCEKKTEGETTDAVEQALAYMHERYWEQVPIRTLARIHGLSPTNFAASFRKRTGLTPVEYWTRLRIEKAKSELVSSQRLSEVAQKVGYQDELYFSRMFKKIVGVAPTLYMKRHGGDKVVAIDPIVTDYLLALNVEPVGAVHYEGGGHIGGRLPYLAGRLANTKLVGSYRQPDWRRAVELTPRLMLGMEQHNGGYADTMKKIAPTILLSLLDDWRALLREIAALTERSEQSEAWLDEFERKAEQTKQALGAAGIARQTVMVLIVTQDELRVYGGKRQLGELLYNDLGLRPPAGIRQDEHYRSVSVEELTHMDPDYVVLTIVNWGACRESKRRLQESLVWQQLRAVRLDRVFEVDSWMNGHAPLGRTAAMEHVSRKLLLASDRGFRP